MVTASRGETITLPHDGAPPHAWLLKEGRVRLVRLTPDGRTLATDILGPGEVIGEASLLAGTGEAESAEAVEDALLCRIPAGLLRELCERNPELSMHIAKRVGRQRLRIESRLADLLFCTVPVRVARLLLDLSERYGKTMSGGTLIDLRLTHQEIGDLVGANREAVTRAIDAMLDSGAVGYEGRKIMVRSRPALFSAANGQTVA